MPTPKPQEGKGGRSYVEKPLCAKCDKRHDGKCLVGMGNCYGCGKSGHMKRDCPMMKSQERENSQAQQSSQNMDAPRKNHVNAQQSRSDQESSPDVFTGMLKLFSFDVYAMLDQGDLLSFVTLLLPMKFEILPDLLEEPFSVSTPVGDSVVVNKVYNGCPITFPNRVTLVDFIELDMLYFDVIFGKDWLYACFASNDCRTRIVKFQFPNEPIF